MDSKYIPNLEVLNKVSPSDRLPVAQEVTAEGVLSHDSEKGIQDSIRANGLRPGLEGWSKPSFRRLDRLCARDKVEIQEL